MSHNTAAAPTRVTPTSLIDEVMGVFMRGENALFADLARTAWQPQATLASLAGSLAASPLPDRDAADQRDAA